MYTESISHWHFQFDVECLCWLPAYSCTFWFVFRYVWQLTLSWTGEEIWTSSVKVASIYWNMLAIKPWKWFYLQSALSSCLVGHFFVAFCEFVTSSDVSNNRTDSVLKGNMRAAIAGLPLKCQLTGCVILRKSHVRTSSHGYPHCCVCVPTITIALG